MTQQGVDVEFDAEAIMRDGTVLRADIYRPKGAGPWPVLVQRTPYDKRGLINWILMDAIVAVSRGYIVVQQDTRGRFASDGEWLPFAFEREDGYDTVEWAATLPGSNGRVGMFGASYTGSTQWSAAMMRPPHLVAIAPLVTWSDPEDGVMFRGGAMELGLNASWALGNSLAQYSREALDPEALSERFAIAMADYDALGTTGYWELPAGRQESVLRTGYPDIGVGRALVDPATMDDSRVCNRYDEVTIPSLSISGWYDVFGQGALDNFGGMTRRENPARLVVGPWHHSSLYGLFGGITGDVNFGSSAAVMPGGLPMTASLLDWFDRWMGTTAPAPEAAPVSVFVMGINQWRDEQEWPLRRAVDTPLYLHPASALSFAAVTDTASSSRYRYDPTDPVMTAGGAMLMTGEYPPGPTDQAPIEARDDVLVFSTPVLDSDTEVTGRVKAVLFAATDAESTDWVVRVCDVDESGLSLNIVDGIVRVHGTPGAVERHEIDLWSTSIVFRAGHRIRVHVTSSNFPRWDRNLGTGESILTGTRARVADQTVFHDAERASHVILPIVAPSAG